MNNIMTLQINVHDIMTMNAKNQQIERDIGACANLQKLTYEASKANEQGILAMRAYIESLERENAGLDVQSDGLRKQLTTICCAMNADQRGRVERLLADQA